MKKFLAFTIILPFVLSCDEGLTLPPDVEPGIEGMLTVSGPWAHPDSIDAIWLFASQIYPLDSALVISGIFQGKIEIFPSLAGSLPIGFDTLSFSFELTPATYPYIGVMQWINSNSLDLENFRVVGVYSDPISGQPLSVQVGDYEIRRGINISVDFYNLPPQPF